MREYFIPKTGFNFFDIARAYGLGIVAYALSDESDVTVEDSGFAYKITVGEELNIGNTEEIQRYLPSQDSPSGQYWEYVLKTSNIKNKLKQEVKNFFKDPKNIKGILEKHSNIENIAWVFNSSTKGKKKPKKKEKALSLPQSLELGAGKGIRATIPSTLTEKGLELPPEHKDQLYLAILGALNASVYSFHHSGSTTYTYIVYPLPGKVDVEFITTRAITNELRKALANSHKAGLFPTLAYIAVEMEMAKRSSFLEEPTLVPSLIYGVMAKSPQAKDKPYSTGRFPLELVSKVPSEVLSFWRNILRRSDRKGYEDIAMALSKFMAEPTLENYYSYIRLHLRNELRPNSIKFGSYDADSLLEVLKNVEVS